MTNNRSVYSLQTPSYDKFVAKCCAMGVEPENALNVYASAVAGDSKAAVLATQLLSHNAEKRSLYDLSALAVIIEKEGGVQKFCIGLADSLQYLYDRCQPDDDYQHHIWNTMRLLNTLLRIEAA